ncbi:MAG TPA: transporter [Cyanobacteria bacterium UBA11049]|nr:transporter [Cyanobacteria bacterium UBA11049]
MKGQQLFHSFLPGVTVAVLTTQTGWADIVKVNQVKQPVSSNVSNIAKGRILLAENFKPQLSNSVGNKFPALFTPAGITTVNPTPIGSNTPQAIVNGKTGIPPTGQIPGNQATTIDFTPGVPPGGRSRNGDAAKLLQQVEFCPQDGSKPVGSKSCSQQNANRDRVAQGRTSNRTASAPSYLNPSSNPLQFPTKPEEVRLQGNQPITLGQALELARRNNRELQTALLTLERSQQAVREAQAALLPDATLTTNLARSGQNGLFGEPRPQTPQLQQLGIDTNQNGDTTNFSATAQLTYDLYTSGSRQSAIRAAEEQQRSDELDVERLSEEIRLNVSTEYFDLQQADEQVRINQAAVRNAQASLRDALAQERAGVGTRFDVLRAQVNLANAEQDLTNSISQQRIARRRLAVRLSLSQAVDISAADPVQLAGLWNQTLENSIVLAYQNRPELQQQLAQRNASEQRRRQALATLGPQVSLVGSYGLQDEFSDAENTRDNYSLGVRASLNLFDGGAARARAAQQRANIRIAETQFAEQRNQIRFQVEQAYSNLQANLDNVQTSSAALNQAREALRLARLRFQAGVGTQTDVIAAENDLTRAEGNRVTAILDYNRSLVQLQRSVTTRASR